MSTLQTYVQAGVISPDEVRDNLIKDPNSGFNDITGELEEGEEFSFSDEPDGGSSNEQNPFKSKDQWEEGDPRRANGQFGEGNGSNSSKGKNKPSERHNRVKSRQRKPLNLSDTEKAVLRDAVARNQFNDEEKESGYATRYTSQYKYTLRIEDPELLSYTPVRRWKIK